MARALLAEPAEVVAATLAHCADAAVLDAVISALPVSVQQMFLARFAPALPPATRAAILAVTQREGPRNAAPSGKADTGPAPGRPALGRQPDSTERTPPLPDPQPPRRRFDHRAPDTAAPPVGVPRPSRHPDVAGAALRPVAQASGASAPLTPATAAGSDPDEPKRARGASNIPDMSAVSPSERIGAEAQPSSAAWPTQWGGLVYLVTLALRLGMPEALWRIGVSEGAALSAMLGTISGAPDDPASAALAAEYPRRPEPLGPVPDWAREEFCATLTTAANALAGTDLGARIETAHAALAEDGSWRLPEWGAAVLVVTLAEMIGRPLDAAAVADLFGIAGKVEIGARIIHVRLPSDTIDFDIRRAGLDANPGHLPWLDRRLEITFGAGEEDWAG